MAMPKARAAREAQKITLEDMAESVGISVSQMSRIETGEREPRIGEVQRIARRLRLTVPELIGEEVPAETCPVVGLVSAGSDAIIFSAGQGPFEYVQAPEGSTEKTVAVEIRGKSLGELFEGWLLFYDDIHDPPTASLIGHLCVIGLDDGRVVAKKLRRGQRPSRYNLFSNTEPPIYDAKVIWAARVREMKPR
jgi:transcriptional regulator with XRE-family HTH domain